MNSFKTTSPGRWRDVQNDFSQSNLFPGTVVVSGVTREEGRLRTLTFLYYLSSIHTPKTHTPVAEKPLPSQVSVSLSVTHEEEGFQFPP